MKKIIILSSILLLTCIASSQDKLIYSCGGTEPFWDAYISDSNVVFRLAGEDTVLFKYTGILPARGYQAGFIMIFELKNEKVKPAYLILKKTEKCKCTDGMSDNEYEYEAYLIIDNITYFGCGIKK